MGLKATATLGGLLLVSWPDDATKTVHIRVPKIRDELNAEALMRPSGTGSGARESGAMMVSLMTEKQRAFTRLLITKINGKEVKTSEVERTLEEEGFSMSQWQDLVAKVAELTGVSKNPPSVTFENAT